ncbi:MAG: metal ABC transporter solute-binding protein, Zn/Mn family, partial [Alphaproteobacteria bacterium]
MRWPTIPLLFIALFVTSEPAPAATERGSASSPRVVATFKPIHSLVAGVMNGAGSPTLLVSSSIWPLPDTLSPVSSEALKQADVVVRVGGSLEKFLDKFRPGGRVKIVTLNETADVSLLARRDKGFWEIDGGEPEPGPGIPTDPYSWLDSYNARALVLALATTLGSLDPDHAAIYQRNAQRMIEQLEAQDAELGELILPVGDTPV